eukprot:CAMPEP_0114118540 /NCGR_PEP_ID=MMETSP0043_2-20121206/5634_1 /TAXON_ID=464988 /ORGANISM="Hemiselmis andersenii, Strain CCMP644" /LENGTH=36 /DNA_ID= /DNA_START= /DNA_END= /DNA_ORIENTATION=
MIICRAKDGVAIALPALDPHTADEPKRRSAGAPNGQ